MGGPGPYFALLNDWRSPEQAHFVDSARGTRARPEEEPSTACLHPPKPTMSYAMDASVAMY